MGLGGRVFAGTTECRIFVGDKQIQKIDEAKLTKLVAEAVELTKFCRQKLTHADQQLTTLMADLTEDPAQQRTEASTAKG